MPRTLPLPKGNEKIWLNLLPRAVERQHGRYVYMFRNTQTNQVVYTHYPKIEVCGRANIADSRFSYIN
jgi:hypothetical protein